MSTQSIEKIREGAIKDSGGSLILRCEVGSNLHGLAVAGQDDHDELGVFIESPDLALRMQGPHETIVRRSQPEGVRSQPGDIDITLHSLRKYVRLLVSGNPTILQTLFVPDDSRYEASDVYWTLANMAPLLRTRRTVGAFLGYLHEQRARLVGERGQKNVKRDELIALHGYDTKYAAHAARLGIQGVEFAMDGRMRLPMRGDDLEACRAIREGELSLEESLELIDTEAKTLTYFLDHGDLPRAPDMETFNRVLVGAYKREWGIR